MTKEQYIKITEPMRQDPEKTKKIIGINQILTSVVFMVYPLYIAVLYGEKDPKIYKVTLVPAISFILVSIFRKLINAPRPYEKFDIPPVLEKDTKGKSFPSRHVFSIFVIAVTIFYSHPGPGIVIALMGVLMAFIRVYGGVHEPRDVIAGAVIGLLCGFIGFYVL